MSYCPPKTTNRRTFLKRTALGALALGLPSPFLSRGAQGPGKPLSLGFVGAGERGSSLIPIFTDQPGVSITAICDCDEDGLKLAVGLPGCDQAKIYSDFRILFEKGPQLDAVVVATPDHSHSLAAILAMAAGKDVYLEKPMSLSVAESRAILRAAQKYHRVVQVGTQQRSGELFQRACNLVQSGAVGELSEVHVWCPGSVDMGSRTYDPVPMGLNYDLWIGPAPASPYFRAKCETTAATKTWWYQRNYSLGFLATWGIHPLDIACMGAKLSLSQPIEIEGSATFADPKSITNTPLTWTVNYQFPSGLMLKFTGHSLSANTIAGHLDVHPFRERFGTTVSHGTAFVGRKGWLCVDRSGIRASSASLQAQIPESLTNAGATEAHVKNFVECVHSRSSPVSSPETAIVAETLCHFADIAIRQGRKLVWDPKKSDFNGDKEASACLKPRLMRPGWKLPSV